METPEEIEAPRPPASPDPPGIQAVSDSAVPGLKTASNNRSGPGEISRGILVLESRAIPAVWLLRATMLVMAVQGYVYWCLSEGERSSEIKGAYEATLVVFWILFVVTGIFYLRWKYRANANLQSAGKRRLKYTPFGCCGYYFMPFLNFVFPMRAMHEIQLRSKANVGYMVYIWWLLMMLGTVIERAVVLNASVMSTREWIVLIATSGLRMIAGFLLISIIKTVTEKQRRYRLAIEDIAA